MTDRKTIAQGVLDRIANHDGDLNAAYPNPFRFHNRRLGRKQAFFDRELAHLLTERDPSRPWGWDADGSFFVRPNQKAVADFIEGRLTVTDHRWRTGHGKPAKNDVETVEEPQST